MIATQLTTRGVNETAQGSSMAGTANRRGHEVFVSLSAGMAFE